MPQLKEKAREACGTQAQRRLRHTNSKTMRLGHTNTKKKAPATHKLKQNSTCGTRTQRDSKKTPAAKKNPRGTQTRKKGACRATQMKKKVPAGLIVFQTHQRFDFDAIRAWRITVAVFLAGSLLLLKEQNVEFVWFFPWFMGFAIMGAGASSVCPVLLFIRWIGFK